MLQTSFQANFICSKPTCGLCFCYVKQTLVSLSKTVMIRSLDASTINNSVKMTCDFGPSQSLTASKRFHLFNFTQGLDQPHAGFLCTFQMCRTPISPLQTPIRRVGSRKVEIKRGVWNRCIYIYNLKSRSIARHLR